MVMQESFRHAQRIILKIIGGHPDLSDQLLLGCRQLRRSHFHIPHSFQFLIGQFQTSIHIFNIRPEVNAESTCIGIRSQIGFDIINQSPAFTKRNIQFAVHSRTAEDIIQQIVSEANRRVNEASPIADARLYDGSRVNIVLNPVALNGPAVTIRKFPDTPLSMNDLIQFGTLTHETADFLHLLVLSGYNIFVCGGTGSGKTTFLNVLSDFIPSSERVITIEDSAELQLHIPNIVKLEARQANTDGKNEITIRDLIRSSLRMRPNRIIVGEIRGAEALDMLTAFNTGHDGSMSTGHGNSPRDMLRRIETMVLMGVDMPVSSIKGQIASAIDIIVFLGRMRDHSRRVLEITEIADFTDNEIILNPLYIFKESGSTQKVTGSLQKTGNSLKDITKIQMSGHTALLKEFL